jgi:hypothetical protein
MSPLFAVPALILQSNDSPLPALFGVFGLTIVCAILVSVIAGMWMTFTKAGEPGWGVLIPIYNVYLMTQIAKRPGWWVLLMFIPFVNLIIQIIVAIGIAENFGKSAAFGIGLMFLPFIFYPIIGFGDAVYQS